MWVVGAPRVVHCGQCTVLGQPYLLCAGARVTLYTRRVRGTTRRVHVRARDLGVRARAAAGRGTRRRAGRCGGPPGGPPAPVRALLVWERRKRLGRRGGAPGGAH